MGWRHGRAVLLLLVTLLLSWAHSSSACKSLMVFLGLCLTRALALWWGWGQENPLGNLFKRLSSRCWFHSPWWDPGNCTFNKLFRYSGTWTRLSDHCSQNIFNFKITYGGGWCACVCARARLNILYLHYIPEFSIVNVDVRKPFARGNQPSSWTYKVAISYSFQVMMQAAFSLKTF